MLRARSLEIAGATEWVPLEHVHGRCLAAAVVARYDLPPAPSSAMDGWAVRSAGGRLALRITDESAAGHGPARSLHPGEACRISTGALIPDGADAVVRREDGREIGGRLVIDAGVTAGDHVRPRGDDLAEGERLLEAGTVVAAHELAVLAAAGHAAALCRVPPVASFLTTGDELVAPGSRVPHAHRTESNLAALGAQARAAGAVVGEHVHAGDDRRATVSALAALLDGEPGLIVTVGGVSVGDHDHVAGALTRLGARWAFRGVAMRPGHPVGLAVCGSTVILALPGNPAAAVVAFHLLGRPLLGTRGDWSRRAALAAPCRRHPRATTFMRCSEAPEGLRPLARQGSAQLGSLAGARALAWIDPGEGTVDPGTLVPVSALP
ncbi:MAG: molybdopterin molybdotransferase MoeA [Thermoleophilia bacterium]